MSTSYKRTSDAAVEPLSLDEAKAWLRVTDTDEDDLITALITAARQAAERRTSRGLIQQTWQILLDDFPADGVIHIPVAPVISVDSIGYTDADGGSQTFDSDNYETDLIREPGRIVLKPSASWPSVEDGINKVTVTFKAGYGTAASDVPDDLITAVRYILSEWFTDRREISHGNPQIIPLRANAILWSYRIFTE